MVLKSEYELEEEIPLDLDPKDLYEERDGKWVLKRNAIEGVKTDADVLRIQRALNKERDARKQVEASLRSLPGSPEELLDELEALRAGRSEEKKQEPDRTQSREFIRLQQELDDYKSRSQTVEEKYNSFLLKDAVTRAATDLGVTSEALEDVQLWGTKLFTVKDGEVVAKDESSALTPEDWLSDIRANGKKNYWFGQSVGAGARGSKAVGSSPEAAHFKKETFNFSKVMELARKDPEKADRLAKMAGFDSTLDAVQNHNK